MSRLIRSCQSSSILRHEGQAMNKERLWHECFSGHAQWWNILSEKEIPLNFEHNSFRDTLWIESWLILSRVKEKSVAMILSRAECDGGLTFAVDCGASGRYHNSLPGLNHVQLFVWDQCSSQDSTSPITTAFERGPNKGAIQDSCGISGNMRALCKEGRLKEALHFLELMGGRGIKADAETYICLLQCCIKLKALTEGKRVHFLIMQSGFKPNIFLSNTIVNMYAKCGRLFDARQVFDRMFERNACTWTTLITAYVNHGHPEEAFKLFRQMEEGGAKPDMVTYLSVLKVCASLGLLDQGRHIHANIVKCGINPSTFVWNSLVDMYAKCGSINDAREVFEKMPKRDVVSWNAMILGYAQHGYSGEAFKLFWHMEQEGVKPDEITFMSILKACTTLEQGKQIHARIHKCGFESDVFVGNTLVNMYAKCGSVKDAHDVFHQMFEKDIVSWNAIISGYAQQGHSEEAVKLYWQMQQVSMKPNKITFVSVLNACASLASLEQGKQVHAHIIKGGFETDIFVGNALIDMYAKCGSVEKAHRVFEKMVKRNVVSWTVLIAGYIQHGHDEEALRFFWQMQQEGVKPDNVTFLCVLNACASLAALDQGRQIHAQIITSGYESDVFVGSTLVDMYAKCGNIEIARQVFDKMPIQNEVSWNAMIAGYAQHGCGNEALQLVKQMQGKGMKLDHFTFVGALSACSHMGLVDEGCIYFDSMSRDHGIAPMPEHYACMVDLLGRAGHLEEAENFIKKMPFEPCAVVWTALLGACKIHGNMDLAKRAAECILELEPHNTAAIVVLSNIHAAAGRWDDKARVRKIMEDKRFEKGVRMQLH